MEQICFGLNGELLPNVFLVDKNGKVKVNSKRENKSKRQRQSESKSEKQKSFEGYTFLYINDDDGMFVKKLISLGKLIDINGKYYKDKSKDKRKVKIKEK